MARAIFYFFLILSLTSTLSSCSLLTSRHFGQVKELPQKKQLKRDQQVIMIPTSHVYSGRSNIFISRHPSVLRFPGNDTIGTNAPMPYGKPLLRNQFMHVYETAWDSIIQEAIQKRFENIIQKSWSTDTVYGEFRFPFRYRVLSTVEWAMGDLPSIRLARMGWLIKDGYLDSARKSIPADILHLSREYPVLIIVNYTSFGSLDFQANYGSGSTGPQFVPISMVMIIENGNFIYYRKAQDARSYKNEKQVRRILRKITEELFDKLEVK
jgi:hypothetical protein